MQSYFGNANWLSFDLFACHPFLRTKLESISSEARLAICKVAIGQHKNLVAIMVPLSPFKNSFNIIFQNCHNVVNQPPPQFRIIKFVVGFMTSATIEINKGQSTVQTNIMSPPPPEYKLIHITWVIINILWTIYKFLENKIWIAKLLLQSSLDT